MKIKLFYSYSHKDARYRDGIEKVLKLLKKDFGLLVWSDRNISPGQSISKSIERELNSSQIYLFLFSRTFIASEPCVDEWERVKIFSQNRHIYRIPIILESCPWKDFIRDDDVKALPDDGHPLQKDQDDGYMQIYEGVKQVIQNYRQSYIPRNDFLDGLKKTDFISQQQIPLEDIFVFPTLSVRKENILEDVEKIKNVDGLLNKKHTIIKGKDNSGKTALCKYIVLHLIERGQPVIYIDLNEVRDKTPNDNIFKERYERQFNGDYELWKKQEEKVTIIFDNLSNARHSKKHVLLAKKLFNRVVVSAHSDQYDSYFYDDEELADFSIINIYELSHVSLESLIKKRLALIKKTSNVNYEDIDQAEDKINAVLGDGIVERYPFYILSILQTFEAYMPSNLEISSYGHCYKALITAHLVKSGVGESDSDLNACFNFLEQLAFEIYSEGEHYSYDSFKQKYGKTFLITASNLNKLTSGGFNMTPLVKDGAFSQKYSYLFFLGSYLARNSKQHEDIIKKLTNENYIKDNNQILIFILHHTTEIELIDNVMLQSLRTFYDIPEATLCLDETKNVFGNITSQLPKNIPSSKSVDKARQEEREIRDDVEHKSKEEEDYDGNIESINNIYKILKNNELLGQVLRNHHGNLKRKDIDKVIRTVIESGLRLVGTILDEKGIEDLVSYCESRTKGLAQERLRMLCERFCFFLTMSNLETIVHCISVNEIQPLIEKIVKRKSTPACDLIQYFAMLNTTDRFSDREKKLLRSFCKKYNGHVFIEKVLALRTQYYFNTHKVDHNIKQSTFSLLGIPYKG